MSRVGAASILQTVVYKPVQITRQPKKVAELSTQGHSLFSDLTAVPLTSPDKDLAPKYTLIPRSHPSISLSICRSQADRIGPFINFTASFGLWCRRITFSCLCLVPIAFVFHVCDMELPPVLHDTFRTYCLHRCNVEICRWVCDSVRET